MQSHFCNQIFNIQTLLYLEIYTPISSYFSEKLTEITGWGWILRLTQWTCFQVSHIKGNLSGMVNFVDCCLLTIAFILLCSLVSDSIHNDSPWLFRGFTAIGLGGMGILDGCEASLYHWHCPQISPWPLTAVQSTKCKAKFLWHGIVYHRVYSTVGVDACPTEQEKPGIQIGCWHKRVDQN